ncbi:MAG: helix-turn-helix domain-containing protein [bacterium]
MESIGDRLRVAREGKGYSFEQVARDTHIAKRYIEAMEKDDYHVFPGEPYLIGFLKNYSEYLDVSSEEVLNRYRNLKLQEQPAPMDQLLDTGRSRKLRTTLIVVIAVLVLIAAASAVAMLTDVGSGVSQWFDRGASEAVPDQADADTDTVEGNGGISNGVSDTPPALQTGSSYVLERSFFRGERFVVDLDGQEVQLSFDDIGEQVRVRYPGGTVSIPQGTAGLVDLDNSGTPDIRVIVRNVALDTTPPEAVIRIDRQVEAGSDIAANEPESPATELPPTGSAGVEWRERPAETIRSTFNEDSFSLELEALESVLIRVSLDDAETQQHVLETGERLAFTASNHAFISASNGSSISLSVEGTEVELGGPGQVSSVLVGLADRNAGSPRLAAIPSY